MERLLQRISIALICFAILMIPLLPIAAIWSVNTLFHTEIDYTVKAYFAAFFLVSLVGSSAAGKR